MAKIIKYGVHKPPRQKDSGCLTIYRNVYMRVICYVFSNVFCGGEENYQQGIKSSRVVRGNTEMLFVIHAGASIM
jgi:hypothetical protein